jgi:hypothetical protein
VPPSSHPRRLTGRRDAVQDLRAGPALGREASLVVHRMAESRTAGNVPVRVGALVLPGLLQTADYARAILAAEPVGKLSFTFDTLRCSTHPMRQAHDDVHPAAAVLALGIRSRGDVLRICTTLTTHHPWRLRLTPRSVFQRKKAPTGREFIQDPEQ